MAEDAAAALAAGRSIREVERREANLTEMVSIAFLALMIESLFFEIIGDAFRRRAMAADENF